MTFQKINDWNNRKQLVNEYINLQKELKNRFISERIGEEYSREERIKQIQPLLEENKKTQELISDSNKYLKDVNKKFIKAIEPVKTFPIKDKDKDKDSQQGYFEGEIATNYIDNSSDDRDNGVYSIKRINDGKLKIGSNQNVTVRNNNIYISDSGFEGTERLWELLTKKNPNPIDYNNKDDIDEVNKYLEILKLSGEEFKQGKTGMKYKNVIKPAIDYFSKKTTGSNISQSSKIILPCNPDDLIERMDLLIASKEAGNTGVDAELEMIFKTLYEKELVNKSQLKKLYTKYLN